MSGRRLIFLLLVACGLTSAGCVNRMGAATPAPGSFVFVSSRSGANDVYLSDETGRHVRAVTHDVTDDANPHLMKNGQIVFASRRTGTWQIYTMHADGSNVQAVTQDRAVNNYRPFPTDDGRILFVSDRYLRSQIFSISPDGSDLRRMTTTDDYNDFPVSNSDGYVYFTSSRSTKWEVWRMTADGSEPTQITQTTGNILDVAVLPPNVNDAREQSTNRTLILPWMGFYSQPKIVYTMRSTSGYSDLYRMNQDGSDIRQLTTNQHNMNRSPVYASSGQLLFTSDRAGNTDIWSMSPDGFAAHPVVEHPAYDSTS